MALTRLSQQWQELYKTTLINPFLFSFLLISLLFVLKFYKGGSKLNLPPSPPRLPLIGHLHLLGTLPHHSFHTLAQKYGPILFLYFGCAPTLVVTSAEIAKEIMKTQDVTFASRKQTRAAESIFYGCRDLAFAPHGDYWRQTRRICVLQLLSHKRLQSFHCVIEEEITELIKKIRGASLDGASVNLGETFGHTMTNIISRCVLGRRYEGDDSKKRFGELTRTAIDLMGEFCFQDFFPSLGWMDALTGFARRLRDTSEGLDAFLDEVIEEHRNSKGGDDQPDKTCFVEILLQLQKEGMLGIDITQDSLKAILLDMFIGGTNTTTITIEWAMTQLMKHPTKMKRAQEEVRRVVGKKSNVEKDDIDKMDYLKCVVKETLRLQGPAPFLLRETSKSAKLEGYDIPPKTRVLINAWAIQRDPKLWDKPEEFLPEGFVNNPTDYNGQGFQFIPFGAGRRGCPGISLRVMDTQLVLANLLNWFDWKLPGGGAGGEDLDTSEAYGFAVRKKLPLQRVPLMHPPVSLN